MLSVDAIRSDLWLQTNVSNDNNVQLDTDVTDVRHNAFAMSQVRTKLRLILIYLTLFAPDNLNLIWLYTVTLETCKA